MIRMVVYQTAGFPMAERLMAEFRSSACHPEEFLRVGYRSSPYRPGGFPSDRRTG
jgi:hypothetical protein